MLERRKNCSLMMLESGEQATIDIDAIVSYKSSFNTLEIILKRDTEVLLVHQRDGSVDTIGSNTAPPFPIPYILLKDIVSFDPHNINPLLQLDPVLCDHLSVKIASKAAEERVSGPLYIFLYVTVTPHRFVGDDIPFPELDEEMETCAICLEELNPRGEIYFDMPNCSHQFHDLCISMWLTRSNACPICRAFVVTRS
ncbi:RING/U-box superfamily protein [Raphanus sativus]|nr:RING/U-box superfamily protein [Raphanus sativus]